MNTLLVLVLIGLTRAEDPADFDTGVGAILARRCLDCHSGPDPKGKLDLSTRASSFLGGESGPAVVANRPDESPLWERVESGEMPPKAALSESEKTAIRDWIARGGHWGTDPIDGFRLSTARRAGRDWWSLQPVVRPVVPSDSGAGKKQSPIDAFVRRKLQQNQMSPSPAADRRSLIRRLSFDLTGLPPSPEEVESFLADPDPEAYAKRVDRWLESPEYGVRWARWWLDLARFGESHGFEFDEFRPNAWRYRDWVVNALNRDLPYDEFARLQLAGDVLQPQDSGAVEATGFLVAGAFDTVGQSQLSPVMRAVVRADELEDVIATVSQAFLGLTVHCARCHDHKFDPIRQSEYYRIASSLEGVRHGERDLSSIDPELGAIDRKIAQLSHRLQAIEAPIRAGLPSPIAAWNFDKSLDDLAGRHKLKLEGGAERTSEGLRLDGKTGQASATLGRTIQARTIETWVRLDNLTQRGGGVLGLQTPDGQRFDSLVFGEQEPGRWIAGSEGFARTRRVVGEAETETGRPIHLAVTYASDGMIQLYRDGQPHGKAYRSNGPIEFEAGRSELLFGLRHSPAGPSKFLAGTIIRARLYDRALEPAEIAASAASSGAFISLEAIVEGLPDDLRFERERLIPEIESLKSSRAGKFHRAYAVTPRPAGTTRVQLRGNPGQPGDTVSAGGVSAVQGPRADFEIAADAPEAERRKRLAGWITGPENPLFARTIVNRLWQAHFGTGLVETPSDLGFNGGRPSHPELLDWLASEIQARGWSLKAIHRLIVMSETYRQSSRLDPLAMSRDAGNRLLWRKSPSRLEAEMVRDAMMAVSGRLDDRKGGPSYFDHAIYQGPGSASILYVPVAPESPGLNRRTLYRAWSRGGRSGLLDAFDCPDPSSAAPRRPVTTTPLQALTMMNNAEVLYLAERFGQRLTVEGGPDPGRQVRLAYRLAYGREPTQDELSRAIAVVEKFGPATLARAIFNSGEFLYLD